MSDDDTPEIEDLVTDDRLEDEISDMRDEFATREDVNESIASRVADHLTHLLSDPETCESEDCEHVRTEAAETFAERIGIGMGEEADTEEMAEEEADADDDPEGSEGEEGDVDGEEQEQGSETPEEEAEGEGEEEGEDEPESDHWVDGW